VPSWYRVRHAAFADSVLLSYSDQPVQKALHLFKPDPGHA
jgi:gentisate 1,2-dioxygenase